MKFERAWRWFGDNDPVPLAYVRQMGVRSVVTAVHSRAPGQLWTREDIRTVKSRIEDEGMRWNVVESLPVAEGIKLHDDSYDQLLENYAASLKELAAAGIDTVCYNFMPVLDWVRTDLHHRLSGGGVVMQFDISVFAAFDIFILKRPRARDSYDHRIVERAEQRVGEMSEDERERLAYNIIVYTQGFINGNVSDSEDYKGYFRSLLSAYEGIDEAQLRGNLRVFLNDILPIAESAGITMAIHPDDPPMPVLGLPRIVKNIDDLDWIFTTNPSPSNGLTFCSGSLSAVEQDVYRIVEAYADRIAFLHLRNTRKAADGVFHESGHLDGDVDMVKLISLLLSAKNVPPEKLVPVRPDHGVAILDDEHRNGAPGYPLYGRLVGLTEICAIEAALQRSTTL
jgi:mannonate dehydratase